MFHGHGVGIDDTKDNILRYFRQVDRGLHEWLREERAPLILAGVDYLVPIYLEVNTYPQTLKDAVKGNPEALADEELHEKALDIIEPVFAGAAEEAVSRYRDLSATDLVSRDIKIVVPAAHEGRVETLFTAAGVRQWGTFDGEEYRLELHGEAKPGNEDLLDLAAAQTLLHAGTVHVLAPEKMPDDSPVAAIFRY